MIFGLLSTLANCRRKEARDLYARDNDPVHYMRELEFRNTIDQYDFAIVMFFSKESQECKSKLPGFKRAAHKCQGRADFISISERTAPDLVDELNVDTFPTYFSFRNGHLIEKLSNTSTPQQIYWYVKNVTAARYRYVQTESEAKASIKKANSTFVISMPLIDARLDKMLAVASTKFYNRTQFLVAQTPELSKAFGIQKFPSFSIIRTHDDKLIDYPGDVTKATVKSLTDFLENNWKSSYYLINNFTEMEDNTNDAFFLAVFDTDNAKQAASVREILDKVHAENPNAFRIVYGDQKVLSRDLVFTNLMSIEKPLFAFIKNATFGYHKWVFEGKRTPLAVAAFCADYLRGRTQETIISTPVTEKSTTPYRYLSGQELKTQLEKQNEKDFVVNFVSHNCPNCPKVDELWKETAIWAKNNGIRHVVFARVNASNNDIPLEVWRNETFPYGWFFPAKNRTGAFPIGKRRDLYWMLQLLVDNSTQPINVQLPPKPEPTPLAKVLKPEDYEDDDDEKEL